jgi:hypothetical protein
MMAINLGRNHLAVLNAFKSCICSPLLYQHVNRTDRHEDKDPLPPTRSGRLVRLIARRNLGFGKTWLGLAPPIFFVSDMLRFWQKVAGSSFAFQHFIA